MHVSHVSYKKTAGKQFKPEQFEAMIEVDEGEDVALAMNTVKALVRVGLGEPAPGDAALIEEAVL